MPNVPNAGSHMTTHTRNGKIARLPRSIREELNRRLADGEIGKQLVAWLNNLTEVQKVLAADFQKRPISEQNLTEWKQGGFEDWQKHQEARAWVQQLVEESDDLAADSGSVPLAERAAIPVMLALENLIRQVATDSDAAEQRKTILSVSQQLTQLRKAGLETERLRLERDRWAMKKEEMRRLAVIQAHNWKTIDLSAPSENQTKSN
jgi:hypothetical protein